MSELPIPAPEDFCWPVLTECVADWDDWEVEPDPDADPPVAGVPLYSDEQKAIAESLAARTLRMLTGYQVGGCPVTVRPCRPGCYDPTWRTYPAVGRGSTPWFPVNLGGTWLNIGCGHGGTCSACATVPEVRLDGPVGAIDVVMVDGAVLSPSAYRLDPGGFLVRTDGQGWPLEQNIAAPDTVEGTWSVTYTPGRLVDGTGAYAAGILAGQFVRACSGGTCDLPETVSQVVRQGITMTLTPGSFPGGKTGIRVVDAYVESINPNALRAPSTVWSPDVPRPRPVG